LELSESQSKLPKLTPSRCFGFSDKERFSANSLGAIQSQKKRNNKKTYSFGFTSLFLYFCLLLFQLVPLPSPKSPIFEPVQLKSKFCKKLLKIIKRVSKSKQNTTKFEKIKGLCCEILLDAMKFH